MGNHMTKYLLAIAFCIFASNQAIAMRPLDNYGWDWGAHSIFNAGESGQIHGRGTGRTKEEAKKNAVLECEDKQPIIKRYCKNNPVHTSYEPVNCRDVESKETGGDHFHLGTTWTVCSGYVLKFEDNGNLVYKNKKGEVIWESATAGSGANKLSIQPVGDMVLYIKAAGSKPQIPVWDTKTRSGPKVYLSVRINGDLVLYSKPANILWSANTKDK